jgi:hypothetical protein
LGSRRLERLGRASLDAASAGLPFAPDPGLIGSCPSENKSPTGVVSVLHLRTLLQARRVLARMRACKEAAVEATVLADAGSAGREETRQRRSGVGTLLQLGGGALSEEATPRPPVNQETSSAHRGAICKTGTMLQAPGAYCRGA